ncbi:hypothetical protein WG219_11265 [Ectopseudomonas mendocina]|uniref:Uncharacterized protein n=1 Tax=Ectopseudomonas mendocina TaxID=300 RepID=A0ABZ2RBX2_ECTME
MTDIELCSAERELADRLRSDRQPLLRKCTHCRGYELERRWCHVCDGKGLVMTEAAKALAPSNQRIVPVEPVRVAHPLESYLSKADKLEQPKRPCPECSGYEHQRHECERCEGAGMVEVRHG